jgi:predicted GH43/DUF377 family glycosyl hydrolase
MSSKAKWRKMGLIYCPSGETEWLHSHAAVPIAENVGGDLFKIYFSSRDTANRSFTGFVIIDLDNPHQIVEKSVDPVLAPGELGGFDDSGTMATWLTHYGNNKFLYYVGWNLGVTVPFRNSIGLAVENEQGGFVRYARGPIVDRSIQEPHFCASCCVIPGSDLWRMWYLSCTGWRVRNGKTEHRYHIKYAESDNGVQWRRDGAVAIDYLNDNEYAISRPSVIKDNDKWRMWFSHRGGSYRIGYAESEDGKKWTRLDWLVGIDVSQSGWDSEMIEYPFVFDHKGSRYMLYNGNGYGKTGFGLAVLE